MGPPSAPASFGPIGDRPPDLACESGTLWAWLEYSSPRQGTVSVHLKGLSKIPELSSLVFDSAGTADAEEVHAIALASYGAIDAPSAEMCATQLSGAFAACLVRDAAGHVVGYGMILSSPSEVATPTLFLAGQVHPDFHRLGIGRSLMRWEISQANRGPEDHPNVVEVTVPKGSAAHRLSRRLGFQEKRRWCQLHQAVPQDRVQAPMHHGLRLERGDMVDWAPLREHRNRSFGDGPYLDDSAWAEFIRGSDLRWDLSRIAYKDSDDHPVGAIYVRFTPDHDAYIDSLVVSPEHRRQGIATVLLRSVLMALQDAGIPGVALDVDTENASNAISLYEKQGFRKAGALVSLVLMGPSQ